MKLINRPAEAFELGYRIGEVRGQLIAAAATPAVARSYELATLAMINVVHSATMGGDAADYELHGAYAEGVRAGTESTSSPEDRDAAGSLVDSAEVARAYRAARA